MNSDKLGAWGATLFIVGVLGTVIRGLHIGIVRSLEKGELVLAGGLLLMGVGVMSVVIALAMEAKKTRGEG